MHRVKIYQGDITKLAVDAIVSATSVGAHRSTAMDVEGTNGNVSSAAKSQSYEVGSVFVSSAENLRAEFMIHTEVPTWRGGDYQEEAQLASCYQGLMDAAKQQNIKSIAIPTISCGASGFPSRRDVKIAIQEVNNALRQNSF